MAAVSLLRGTLLGLFVILVNITHCQAACPDGWFAKDTSCYKVIYSNETFDNVYAARQTCLQDGADIASFPDVTTEAELWETVSADKPDMGDRPSHIYIGAADLSNMGSYSWLDANNSTVAVAYTNFSDNSVGSGMPRSCVAAMSADKEWNVTVSPTSWEKVACCFNRDGIRAVACMKPEDANVTIPQANDTMHQYCYKDCPDGWRYYDNKCYYLGNATAEFRDAYAARAMCMQEGGDLPSVTSPDTAEFLSEMIAAETYKPNSVYLGVRNHDNQTVPLRGSPTGYTEFDEGSLNNTDRNCTIMYSTDGLWDNSTNRKWRGASCCSAEGVTSIVCEKPGDYDYPEHDKDTDVIAVECYADEDECLIEPCQNGGTCQDHVLYYECACVPGYLDVNCSTNFCDCDPCHHDGVCELEGHGYRCDCGSYFFGDHCENVTDVCFSNPCKNNATCSGDASSYNCSCATGYEGEDCSTEIDWCDKLNVTCDNGGTCQSDVTGATCSCPVTYTGDRCETENLCAPWPEVGNSTRNSTTGVSGLQVTYECFSGFKFPDMSRNKTITCLGSGWSEQPADCEPHCEYLPYVGNADNGINPSTAVGSVVNYTCLTGYQLPDNSTYINITCLETLEWDITIENTTQCEIMECPELPIHEHQELATRNRTFNTTVVFWCDVGYVLHDNTTARTIKCLADGDWTAKLPPCQPVRCPHIEKPARSERNTSLNTYNTYAKYTCDKGTRMEDGATWRIIKCDATTEWSDNVTDCGINRCFPLPFVANATPNTLDALFGTVTELTCIPGHLFHPNEQDRSKMKKMTCKNSGRWFPILSACEPIYCDKAPENMTSLSNSPSTNNQLYGTVVNFTCDRGHYYNATAFDDVFTVKCLESEEWDISVIPPCWPIQCEEPPDIENGTRVPHDHTNYSVVVRYTCDPGHLFIDGYSTRNITCQERGTWDQTDVSCRRDRCSPVPKAEHATPDTTNTSWFINITYGCDTGHEWPPDTYGNKSTHHITCENNPETRWNETQIPACKVKHCPMRPEMENATINGSDTAYNSLLAYECNVGFKYPNNDTVAYLWCSPDAEWDPADYPVCEIIHCPILMDVENATRDTNNTEYGTLVTYSCDPGYQYPDKTKEKEMRCTENETWTEYPPPCEVVFCPPVPYWTETEFNTTDNEFDAFISYSCKDGYAFVDMLKDPNATKVSHCVQNKTWLPPIDDCKALESIAADLIGKTWESPQGVPIGTVACTLVCLMVACVILLDLNKLIHDFKIMKSNVSQLVKQRSNKVSDSCTQINPDQGTSEA